MLVPSQDGSLPIDRQTFMVTTEPVFRTTLILSFIFTLYSVSVSFFSSSSSVTPAGIVVNTSRFISSSPG